MTEKQTLITTNHSLLNYSNEHLVIEVPGGIKLEGLDRIRVTLKVELINSPRLPVLN